MTRIDIKYYSYLVSFHALQKFTESQVPQQLPEKDSLMLLSRMYTELFTVHRHRTTKNERSKMEKTRYLKLDFLQTVLPESDVSCIGVVSS
jgi:hypothetical protein